MADKRKRANIRSPYNQDSPLFQRLTRLFSGPIVNYKAQQVRNNRKYKIDKYAPKFKTIGGQAFKKKSYNPFETMSTNMMSNQNRAERYSDFDQMEYMPELASALDIYSDEITTHSEFKKVIKIDCPNEEIKSILEILYFQVLNINFNLFGWVRTMCKYGDFFAYLDIDEKVGIKSLIGLPPIEIERMEGEDPTNPNYIQYQWNSAAMTLENWQVAHFRVLGNDKYSPYGTSVLDPGRRIWRQLTLLEDAMIAYRIVRAPDRRVFYVDVGAIPPEDVEQYMQNIITQVKRHQVVNPQDGRVDLRYNPMSIEEDFYIPVRNGQKSTEITNLAGTQWANAIDDVVYLQDKLFAAIKIPMSYLIRGKDAQEEKTSLSQKDIRFSRTIQRLQRSVISELEKIAMVHLYTLGYRGSDLLSFNIKLHNPSRIAQMQELESLSTRLDIATKASENFFSKKWISNNILDVSDENFIRNQRERFYDKKYDAAIAKIAEITGEEFGAATGIGAGAEGGALGLGAGLGPELGGEEAEELGAEAPAAAAPAPEAAPEEAPAGEDVLLAEPPGGPGKRDDDLKWTQQNLFTGEKKTSTSKSKDKWYKPVKTDKRTTSAPRKKHFKDLPQGGKRRAFGSSLYNGIVNENQSVNENESNYSESLEENMNHINREMRSLLKSLEEKTNETQ
jgi:hypothetical protein